MNIACIVVLLVVCILGFEARAVLLALVPPLFDGMTFTKWIVRALNFLVVSCPCAMVISVPLSFFSGMGAVSKAGMIAMNKCLAQEVGSRGITVNSIAPGFIRTPMTDVLPDDVKAALLAKIPEAKLGEAQDIANVVAFLASDEAQYITGQTININGGMAMI